MTGGLRLVALGAGVALAMALPAVPTTAVLATALAAAGSALAARGPGRKRP